MDDLEKDLLEKKEAIEEDIQKEKSKGGIHIEVFGKIHGVLFLYFQTIGYKLNYSERNLTRFNTYEVTDIYWENKKQ